MAPSRCARGDLPLARSLADAAAIATTLDDRRVDTSVARLVGLVAHRAGDPDAARVALARSLELADAAGDDDPGPAIAARNALAIVEAEQGDRAAAIALLEDALAACRRTGEPHLEAAVENNLADQLHAAGRTEEAIPTSSERSPCSPKSAAGRASWSPRSGSS